MALITSGPGAQSKFLQPFTTQSTLILNVTIKYVVWGTYEIDKIPTTSVSQFSLLKLVIQNVTYVAKMSTDPGG